ncbi:putative ribonuclease H-like domain-containing protein [Tanacetum coccineum]
MKIYLLETSSPKTTFTPSDIVRPKAVLSAVKGNKENVVKGNPQQDLKHKGVIDNVCSRNMTGNRSYLTDYEEIDGGFVAFGGNSKRGKITRKGKIRTSKLDFEDVYFVKELKFNLFSVSQMCDKKNSVLFTGTECVVMSPDFKLTDKSHVLLKVPRKDKMYSVDLKSVIPQGGLTCHFAKATLDESNIWHRRLGHVNFKTMNKLDETSEILKTFITGIENLIDLKVKVIRCDNGTKFKNRVMNQLCEMKGIKREFSVARTPQQNGVAERKNRTLIEAARTMLADSKLPTTFWAEAFNTACYVQKWGPADLLFSQDSKSSLNVGFKPSGEKEKKDVGDPGNESRNPIEGKDSEASSTEEPRINQENDDNINNTNNINTANDGNITNNVNAVSSTVNTVGSEVNVVDPKTSFKLPNDPNMLELEDIVYSDDAEDVGVEADMNNLDTFIPMVVKSAFLYGKIEEEVYVCQPPGFEDPDFPDRRGKIDKTLFVKMDKSDILLVQVYVDDIIFGSTRKKMCTEFEKMMHKKFQMSSMRELTFFLGLQVKQKEDEIFISQDKYVNEILNKFGFSDVKTTRTPMETQKALIKDADGEDVDAHLYRLIIGSLMYLTSLRPHIMFAVCQPKLGLWYPKDSSFDLVAYTDSDYAGASLDRKSTIGGCQFLECRLISWQCKKQIMIANSITEAKYIAASNCCG